MSWTDDRVALLTKLWGEGKTAAEIAATLGGVTRNAVIGKAHRLKLSGRVSPIQQNKKPKVPANTQSKPERKPRTKAVDIPKGQGLSLAELKPCQCRWPSGDPKDDDFGFCGGQIVPGLPYCAEHAKIAYQAATRNKILKAEDFEDKKTDTNMEDEQKIAVNQ